MIRTECNAGAVPQGRLEAFEELFWRAIEGFGELELLRCPRGRGQEGGKDAQEDRGTRIERQRTSERASGRETQSQRHTDTQTQGIETRSETQRQRHRDKDIERDRETLSSARQFSSA
jgi:hypothetical protein